MDDNNDKEKLVGTTFGGVYKVVKQIGSGTFGEIYEAADIRDHTKVAIKFERTNSKLLQLINEYHIYKKMQGVSTIPRFLLQGTQNGYNFIVTELLGMNLEEMRIKSGDCLPLKTVLTLADQMINAVQDFHKKGFIHRDIKPENFLIGGEKNSVHLIDFGLSFSYMDPITNRHINFSNNSSIVGTMRYASVNAISGFSQSRRDDLMSIFYIIVYLLNGRLPWQGISAANHKERYQKVRELKIMFHSSSEFSKLIPELKKLYEIIWRLEFTEEPDYNRLRMLLRNASVKRGYTDFPDWNPLPGKPMIAHSVFQSKPINTIPKLSKRNAILSHSHNFLMGSSQSRCLYYIQKK